MTCGACARESADDFDFCPYCGRQKLIQFVYVCADCGKGSWEEFNFCPNCGEAFARALGAAEPVTPSPEIAPSTEAVREESLPTLQAAAARANESGTYVFGA